MRRPARVRRSTISPPVSWTCLQWGQRMPFCSKYSMLMVIVMCGVLPQPSVYRRVFTDRLKGTGAAHRGSGLAGRWAGIDGHVERLHLGQQAQHLVAQLDRVGDLEGGVGV